MSNTTNVTLRDKRNRNILKLNSKNLPDTLVLKTQLNNYALSSDVNTLSLNINNISTVATIANETANTALNIANAAAPATNGIQFTTYQQQVPIITVKMVVDTYDIQLVLSQDGDLNNYEDYTIVSPTGLTWSSYDNSGPDVYDYQGAHYNSIQQALDYEEIIYIKTSEQVDSGPCITDEANGQIQGWVGDKYLACVGNPLNESSEWYIIQPGLSDDLSIYVHKIIPYGLVYAQTSYDGAAPSLNIPASQYAIVDYIKNRFTVTINNEAKTIQQSFDLTALKNEIPTKVSELQNDEGYIKTYTETDPIYTADKPNIALKNEIPTKVSELQNDEGYIDSYIETDPIYTADKPNIALKNEIPTDLSSFTDTSNIILNAKNNAITEANLYTDQEKVKYLPLTGGMMTGTYITRNVTNSNLLIRGGTAYTTGATLALYGNTFSGGYLGGFRVITHDGTNTKELVGFPDGRLTWNNNPVTALPAGTVAGTLYVGATRQFTTITAALDHIRQSSNGLDKVWNILLDPGEHALFGTIIGLRLNISPVSGSYSTDCRIVGDVTFQDSNITLVKMHIGTESLSSGTASIHVNRGYFVAQNCVFYAGANTAGYSLRFDFCATGQVSNCKFYAPTATPSGSFSSLILHYNSSVYLSGSEGAFIGTSGVTKTYAIRTRSNSCVFLYGQVSVTNYAMGIYCTERSCCFGQSGSFTFSGVTTNSSPADGTVGNDNSYINI